MSTALLGWSIGQRRRIRATATLIGSTRLYRYRFGQSQPSDYYRMTAVVHCHPYRYHSIRPTTARARCPFAACPHASMTVSFGFWVWSVRNR